MEICDKGVRLSEGDPGSGLENARTGTRADSVFIWASALEILRRHRPREKSSFETSQLGAISNRGRFTSCRLCDQKKPERF